MRAEKKHIACCFHVWVCLKHVARTLGKTIYELKQSLSDDYIRFQPSNPSIIFKTAYVLKSLTFFAGWLCKPDTNL